MNHGLNFQRIKIIIFFNPKRIDVHLQGSIED